MLQLQVVLLGFQVICSGQGGHVVQLQPGHCSFGLGCISYTMLHVILCHTISHFSSFTLFFHGVIVAEMAELPIQIGF